MCHRRYGVAVIDTATVDALYRFPVKSMQGETVDRVEVGERGVVGDRTFSLVDVETAQIASCHHPDKWGQLLHCRASWEKDRVVISLPDDGTVTTDRDGEQRLSQLCGREVRFVREAPEGATYELVMADVPEHWPAPFVERSLGITGPAAGRVAKLGVAVAAPPGSLVDVSPVHLVATSSLAALAAGGGDTDVRRFRANVVVDTGTAAEFVEADWNARQITVGGATLTVVMPTMRCLVPTLAQRGLERHRDTLVALTRDNRVEFGPGRWASLGSYASVSTPGVVEVGDPVRVL